MLYRVAFIFGIVLSLSGVLGLAMGSGLSAYLREKIKWIDPVICGVGLLAATPFLFAGVATVAQGVIVAFVVIFFGETFLNMNWAVIVDISLVRAKH